LFFASILFDVGNLFYCVYFAKFLIKVHNIICLLSDILNLFKSAEFINHYTYSDASAI